MRKLAAAIAAVFSLGQSGCADETSKPANPSVNSDAASDSETALASLPRSVSVVDASTLASRGDVTLIDVRREREWIDTDLADTAIGVTLQDRDFVDQILAVVNGDKTKPVALICRSGNRSATAQKKLDAAGFTSVINVDGGMLDWKKQGLPTSIYQRD